MNVSSSQGGSRIHNLLIERITMKGKKTKLILDHLNQYGSITSMQAIELYGVTRLAAIIFKLRKNGYKIITKDLATIDQFGDKCIFANYILENPCNK